MDWQVAKRLWTGSLPISLAVVIYVSLNNGIAKLEWLIQAIGALMILTAIGLITSRRTLIWVRNRRISQPEKFKKIQPAVTILAGVILGLCVAFTSVGAGVLGTLPLLYKYPLRMNAYRLVATDVVHVIPMAMVAGIGYAIAGKVDIVILINILMGSVPSVIVGAILTRKFSTIAVQIALAIILFLIGIKLVT